MAKFTEVTPAQVKTIIESDDPLLLDTRDAHSYKEGHIDGAMLAHDSLTESLIKQKKVERPVVIYCYHGNSSKDLAALFANFGFQKVYSMSGGYTEWKKHYPDH